MLLRSLALAAALAAPFHAFAQNYPSQPVKLVVGFAPGGASDIIARQVAAKVASNLGQSVIVDNRAGAGGTIAAAAVARAAPDGYTLLFASASSLSISPWLNKALPYDAVKSFAPIIELVRGYYVLSGTPTLAITNLKELADWTSRNPGKLSCGSAGVGTIHHLSCELMSASMKMPMVHVPYKGSAPAFAGLMSGEIQVMFESVPTPVPLIHSGQVRGLAVTGSRRLGVLPEVRTFTEQDVHGVDIRFWFGITAPAGTPPAIVERLNAAFNEALKDPDIEKFFDKQGVEAAGGTSQSFGQLVASETRKWGEVVTRAKIQPQ